MACAHLSLQFPSLANSKTLLRRGSAAAKGRVSAFSQSVSIGLRPELDDNPEAIISGEWAQNFSFLTFDDLRFYLEAKRPHPNSTLEEVMSTAIITATADQTLAEIDRHFELVSGLPVVDEDRRCVGVLSKSDRARASLGIESLVGEVMSSPPITLPANKTVKDAAALMLKMKIHRIPIVDENNKVIGMITRTDVLEALEE